MSDNRSFGRSPRATVAALLLGSMIGAGGILVLSPSFAASSAPISVTPVNPQPGFSQLAAKVKPAVVSISTVTRPKLASSDGGGQMQQMPNLPAPFGDMMRQFGMRGGQMRMPEQRAQGSGFIIDPAGYIVTNNHVVDGASEVTVTLTDGTDYKAKVIGRDDKTDLALVKVDAGHELPYVAFGDSDNAHEGDWVIAVGNPYGLGGTITAGIISAHGRNINSGPYDDFLQIDAPINPGNSGGPLFNQTGQVVGIDTAIYSPTGGSVGIGFAIPSNVAKRIVADLREHGTVARGWLGIAMQPLTPALAKAAGLSKDEGVLVNSVTPDSPAAHGDLQQGDVITAYDGKPIKDARDLAMAVAETPAGKNASITLWRDNHQRNVNVTIGTEQKAQRMASNTPAAQESPVGLSLRELTPDVREQLNLGADTRGVLVNEVTDGSRADESGFQAGDVIQRVAGKSVSTPSEVADAIHAAEREKRAAVPVLVMREGHSAFVGLQLS
jgi:serine protease Do